MDLQRPLRPRGISKAVAISKTSAIQGDGETVVYLATDGRGPTPGLVSIKIGVTNNPVQRAVSLQTGNSRRVRILRTFRVGPDRWARDLEETLKSLLDAQRADGGSEWFYLNRHTLMSLRFVLAAAQLFEGELRWLALMNCGKRLL